MGYVPQSLNLDPGLAGHGIRFGPGLYLRLARLPAPAAEGRGAAAEHFSRFDADALLDKLVGRLSGGELQRVLLAVATVPIPTC